MWCPAVWVFKSFTTEQTSSNLYPRDFPRLSYNISAANNKYKLTLKTCTIFKLVRSSNYLKLTLEFSQNLSTVETLLSNLKDLEEISSSFQYRSLFPFSVPEHRERQGYNRQEPFQRLANPQSAVIIIAPWNCAGVPRETVRKRGETTRERDEEEAKWKVVSVVEHRHDSSREGAQPVLRGVVPNRICRP